MKNLLLIAFTTLLLQPFTASAEVCDKDEIIKLMAERNYIDLSDNSFCVDFGHFPNVRVKMAEGSYDLNGTRNLSDKLKGQDENIKRLVTLLNSGATLTNGQKFTIQTKGIADGTFNGTNDQDATILKELADAKGVISPAKIASIIEASDAEGGKAILEEIAKLNSAAKKPNDAGLKFSDIKDDSRLKSMIRNFYLARSRGDKLCSDIFGANGKCDSKGEISPNLDSGKHCFDGCCDERRGAIVDIVAPQKELMSVGGNGNYKAPFKTPSRSYQSKLQMAASMSVFDLPIKENADLENDILNRRRFAENYKEDHERFKEALSGTGCENNPFAIDSVRRIYWTVKGMKDRVSPELYQAVQKNDFNKVYELYEQATLQKKDEDLNLLSSLFSGANTNLAVNSRANCPRIIAKDQEWGGDNRTIRMGKSPYTKCAVISDAESLKGKSIDDINQMMGGREPSVFVVQDSIARNNFYLYDRNTNTKAQFTFDQKSADCEGLDVGRNWRPARTAVRNDDAVTPACIQAVTKSGFKMPNEFYAQAPKVNGVVPSDPLNCLSVAKGIDHEMADQNPNGAPVISKEAENSQKAFCKVQSNNVLNMNIDPADLTVVGGSANGKQGFMCTGCGSGVSYDARTKKFEYRARQEDRQINGGGRGNQRALAAKTWSEGAANKDHPLTMASVKHLRSYVIPNCGTSCEDACACLRAGNIEQRLKDPGVNVMDFSDLSAGNKKLVGSYTGDKPGSFACIYTPPVPHTCSYNPLGATNDEDHSLDHGEDKCPIAEQLKAQPKTAKVVVTDEMIKNYKNNCAKVSFPSTEDQCNSISGGIMCKKKRAANNCVEPKVKAGSKNAKAIHQ